MNRSPLFLLFGTIVVGLIAAYNFFPQLPGSDYAWFLPIVLGIGILVAVTPALTKYAAPPGDPVATRKPDRVLPTTLWIGVGLVMASAPIALGFFLGIFVLHARLVPDIPISVFRYASDVLLLGVTLVLFSTVFLMLGIRGDRVLEAMKRPEKSKPLEEDAAMSARGRRYMRWARIAFRVFLGGVLVLILYHGTMTMPGLWSDPVIDGVFALFAGYTFYIYFRKWRAR